MRRSAVDAERPDVETFGTLRRLSAACLTDDAVDDVSSASMLSRTVTSTFAAFLHSNRPDERLTGWSVSFVSTKFHTNPNDPLFYTSMSLVGLQHARWSCFSPSAAPLSCRSSLQCRQITCQL